MVQDSADVMPVPEQLDHVRVRFDEDRLVSNAGLLLTATLAERLGLSGLVRQCVSLAVDVPGGAYPERKVMTLLHGMIAGADSIDDMNLLRAGSTGAVLGHRVMAPSTLGTFLRAFSFGHVRQLDKVLGHAIERAWAAGAGPDPEGLLIIDIDSFIGEVHGYLKQGTGYGYTRKLGYHPLVATRADTGEVLHIRLRHGSANTQRGIRRFVDELLARVRRAGFCGQVLLRADSGFENHKLFAELDRRGVWFSVTVKKSATVKRVIDTLTDGDFERVGDYPDTGQAQVAEGVLKDWRLIVRRTRLTDPEQLVLWPDWRHHCCATNQPAHTDVLELDSRHRDHAVIEQINRDLKAQALKHFPSGAFAANSAWTVIAALAHNLARWVTQLGDPGQSPQTADTRSRELFRIPGRLVRTARQWTLRLPARWPWQTRYLTCLERLRHVPLLT